jgi:hypothetical protein
MKLNGSSLDDNDHRCHARKCRTCVPPRMLMCTGPLEDGPLPRCSTAVWDAYVPGQEVRKDPTPEYLQAARAAINAVAEREGSRGYGTGARGSRGRMVPRTR